MVEVWMRHNGTGLETYLFSWVRADHDLAIRRAKEDAKQFGYDPDKYEFFIRNKEDVKAE